MTKLGGLNVKFQYKGIERPKTTAIITNANGDVVAEASVKKSKDDVSNKVVGRFWAFRKAMNQAALRNTATKEQRTIAWNQFVSTCKVPGFLTAQANNAVPAIAEAVATN